ncbi:inositol monophosphatase, partial [Bacillus cereus]
VEAGGVVAGLGGKRADREMTIAAAPGLFAALLARLEE